MTRIPIVYLGYYSDEVGVAERRAFAPSAVTKMDYVVSALNRAGYRVDLVSASHSVDRVGHGGRTVHLSNRNTVRFFRTMPWGPKIRRVVATLYARSILLIYLMRNTHKNQNVLVYHSLGYASTVAFVRRVRRFRLVIEVNEIYADVTSSRRDRRREARLFKAADAFILSTQLLAPKVGAMGRPTAIVHGTYDVRAARRVVRSSEKIRVVYAGTLDPRKGGARRAISACELLDGHYSMHILGFGSVSEVDSIMADCARINKLGQCSVTYHGNLSGDDFSEFLQSCDIGLSTQNADAPFNETSFPSKVLTYLAHGLKVVSVRLRVLEESALDDLIHYYEADDLNSLAQAIEAAGRAEPKNVQERLKALDSGFVSDLRSLLAPE